jgi:hypothetical protein
VVEVGVVNHCGNGRRDSDSWLEVPLVRCYSALVVLNRDTTGLQNEIHC